MMLSIPILIFTIRFIKPDIYINLKHLSNSSSLIIWIFQIVLVVILAVEEFCKGAGQDICWTGRYVSFGIIHFVAIVNLRWLIGLKDIFLLFFSICLCNCIGFRRWRNFQWLTCQRNHCIWFNLTNAYWWFFPITALLIVFIFMLFLNALSFFLILLIYIYICMSVCVCVYI